MDLNSSAFPILTLLLWIIFIFYWGIISYLKNKKAMDKQNELSGLIKLVGMIAIIYLPWLLWRWVWIKILPNTFLTGILGTLICVIGLSFAAWARIYLGKNWSGNVVIQKNHELIQTGSYSIVRHPIYAGDIFALLGSAITLGGLWGFYMSLIIAFTLLFKAKKEEKLLLQQFPNEYPEYKKRVKTLIPFIY